MHPADAPTTATHPPRCSYVLLVTVAPCLVLEPGPATSTAALPGRHRLRLRPEGLRARVLLRPLATQKATGLRGRRKGARGVDLAGEPLVQRSHGPPCAGSLVRMLRKKISFLSVSLSSPHPLQQRSKKGEKEAVGKEERRARPLRATRESSRLGVERLCLAQLLRPLPGSAEAKGRSDRFLFQLFFFKSSPWPCSASPKRKARYQKHTKGGGMSRPHYLAPTRYQLIFSSLPGPLQLLLFLLSRVPSSHFGDGTWGAPVLGRLSLMSVGLWMEVQGWGTHSWTGGPVSQ